MISLEKHIAKAKSERLLDVAGMFHELLREAGAQELLEVKKALIRIKQEFRQFETDARAAAKEKQ